MIQKKRRIGVVITHYNRTNLLEKTLWTIKHQASKIDADVNIYIVDDNSDAEYLSDLCKNIIKVNLNTSVLRITKKWHVNPCIPFNVGIKAAYKDGVDIIMIQSAECFHLGNVLQYTLDNLQDGKYLSFATYSVTREKTEQFNSYDFSIETNIREAIYSLMTPTANRAITHCEDEGWYNHSKHRPLGFHWCNAYTARDLVGKIKMFDERYAYGVAYDDNELTFRCNRELECVIVDSPIVLHQWHGLQNYYKETNQTYNQIKQNLNRTIFENVTTKETDNRFVDNNLSENVTVTTKRRHPRPRTIYENTTDNRTTKSHRLEAGRGLSCRVLFGSSRGCCA